MKLNSKNWWQLGLFILICYGVAYIGSVYAPGVWYEDINRAPWSPPNTAFPIVWTILYLFIAIVGWIIFASEHVNLKILWVAQLVLNAAWSWIFFGQHWILLGLIDLIMIVISVSLLLISCWRAQLKLATLLLTPYLIWLSIATSLNAYIFIAN